MAKFELIFLLLALVALAVATPIDLADKSEDMADKSEDMADKSEDMANKSQDMAYTSKCYIAKEGQFFLSFFLFSF